MNVSSVNKSGKYYSGICESCEQPSELLKYQDAQQICNSCVTNVKCYDCKKNITTNRNKLYYSIVDNDPIFCSKECSSRWLCIKVKNSKVKSCPTCVDDDYCSTHEFKWVKKEKKYD